MNPPIERRLLTPKEFLEFEVNTPIKHEYIGERVYEMPEELASIKSRRKKRI